MEEPGDADLGGLVGVPRRKRESRAPESYRWRQHRGLQLRAGMWLERCTLRALSGRWYCCGIEFGLCSLRLRLCGVR